MDLRGGLPAPGGENQGSPGLVYKLGSKRWTLRSENNLDFFVHFSTCS